MEGTWSSSQERLLVLAFGALALLVSYRPTAPREHQGATPYRPLGSDQVPVCVRTAGVERGESESLLPLLTPCPVLSPLENCCRRERALRANTGLRHTAGWTISKRKVF